MSKHSLRAMELFKEGHNCAQSVFGAFSDETGIDFETSLKLSSSLGGGMGRLREVCGAVTSMFLVAGIKYGYCDPSNEEQKTEHYKLIQSLAKRFKDEKDSIICRDLLALAEGPDNPIPEKRSQEYYQTRPCEQLVGFAAQIIDELILEKISDEKIK